MSALLKDLAQLGVHENLLPPMSDELKAELDRRWAWAQANPGTNCSLEELAASLGVRI